MQLPGCPQHPFTLLWLTRLRRYRVASAKGASVKARFTMRQLLTKRWLIVSVVVVAAGVVVTGWAWAVGSSSTAAPQLGTPPRAPYAKRSWQPARSLRPGRQI
jgi:hypothetical protein